MTDDLMDARLRAAGERWRSGNAEVARAAVPAEPPAPGPREARRRGRWTLVASAAVVAAALAVGGVLVARTTGDDSPSSDAAALEGTVWRTDHGTGLFYLGRDDRLVADDGCVVIGARVRLGGSTLTLTQRVSRDYACTDRSGGPDLGSLRDTVRYSLDGHRLTVDGVAFRPAPDGTPPPTLDVPTFVGATWQLTDAQDASGHAARVIGAPELRVSDNGTFSANDGCNTLSGKATGAGPVVDLGDVATTAIGCEGATATLAALVDGVLSGRIHQAVRGTILTVTHPGKGTLTYRWASADPAATDPANLLGRTWHLQSVALDKASIAATLRFDSDSYSADFGCGAHSVPAAVQHGTFVGLGPKKPLSGCHGQSATVGSFLSAWPVVWWIRNDKLVISGGAGQGFVLVYSTADPAPKVSPLGTWRLTQWTEVHNDTAGGMGLSNGPRLTLGRDGWSVPANGCTVSGSLRIATRTMTFGHVRATLCPGDHVRTGAAEIIYSTVGGHTAEWSLVGRQLHLVVGAMTLDFVRV